MTADRLSLMAASFAGILILVGLLRRIRVAAPHLIVPVWFAGIFGIQLVPLFLIALFGISTIAISTRYAPDLAEHPVLVVSVLLLVPATTLASLWCARWLRLISPGLKERTRDVRLSAAAKSIMVSGGLALLLFWPATLPQAGFLGYAVRILKTALLMTPFLAGRYSGDRLALRTFWLAVLGSNALIGIAVGARFESLLPVVLFGLGRISVLSLAERARVTRLVLIALIPAILFLGTIEAVRNQIGRGGLELFTGGRVTAVAEEVGDLAQDASQFWRQAMAFGLYRLINVPSVAVPILSPSDVPYRSPGSLLSEVASYARISALSGQSREDYLEAGLGTAGANEYGFTVDAFTSVEFGLLADSWSRGGAYVAVLVTAALVFLLLLAEQTIVRVFAGDRSLQLLFILVLVKTAIFDAASLPVIASVRQMVLDVGVVATLFLGIQLLPRRLRDDPAS